MSNEAENISSCLPELQAFTLFEGLERESILSLCQGAKIEVNSHRQTCTNIGDPATHFILVLSGAYKLVKTSVEGVETILYFATPGDIIGALVMNKPNSQYPVTSVAMGPSRNLKIPRATYLSQWIQFPGIVLKLQDSLSQRMSQLQVQKTLFKAPLRVRVAQLLIEISDRQNSRDGQGALALPITRKEISESLGVSVEAVIRLMSVWSKEGVIETHDQRISLLRFDKLLAEVKKHE